MACFGAMLWLCDEGLLRYESVISQDAIDQAVLTGIGFNRLSTMRTDLPVIPEPATSGILAREPAIAINHIRRPCEKAPRPSSARPSTGSPF